MKQPAIRIPHRWRCPAPKALRPERTETLHPAGRQLRSGPHQLRIPRRIGHPERPFRRRHDGQPARRREFAPDRPADRRTARFLRLLFRGEPRPRLRIHQLLLPAPLFPRDAESRRGDSPAARFPRARGGDLLPQASAAAGRGAHEGRHAGPRGLRRGPLRSGTSLRHSLPGERLRHARTPEPDRPLPPSLHGRQRHRRMQRPRRRGGAESHRRTGRTAPRGERSRVSLSRAESRPFVHIERPEALQSSLRIGRLLFPATTPISRGCRSSPPCWAATSAHG